MSKALSDEMTGFSTAESREIAFDLSGQRCAFMVEAPGDQTISSLFLLGLPKAGSTLLTRLMKPVVEAAGLTFVAIPQTLRQLGAPLAKIPPEVNQAFRPMGYAFGGFRGLPGALALPAYADGRTILLVRDPRDMLVSLYYSLAFSHSPPGTGLGGELAAAFEKQRLETAEMDINAFVLGHAASVVNQYRVIESKLGEVSYKLYRYEDIIFDKLAWANDMVAYFGLSARPAVVERSAAKNDVRPEVEDTAEHIRKVVPGDHVEKLKAATIAELNGRLAPILAKHGYA